MSRIGKKPVVIPSGVTMEQKDNMLMIKGPKGELSLAMHPKVVLEKTDSEILVSVKHTDNKQEKALRNILEVIKGAKLVRELSFIEKALLIESEKGLPNKK